MSQSVALLVGGTKVLERALQAALPGARHVTAATMEEATETLRSPDVRLLVIGPTMRRGLQAVSALRAGGATEPRILVVFRDDQQSDVRRHQKGTAVADRYLPQSRIGQELGEAAAALWPADAAQAQPAAETELEELAGDSIEEVEAIAEEDGPAAQALSEEPPPVEEVLGEFDAGAFEQDQDLAAEPHEEIVEILEDVQFEEVVGGEEIELAGDAIELEATAPLQDAAATQDAEALDASEWMEEAEPAAEVAADTAEVVEELLDAEPIEELLDAEPEEETVVAEELDAADLMEETPEAAAVDVLTTRLPTPAIAAAEPAQAPQPTFTTPRAPQKTA